MEIEFFDKKGWSVKLKIPDLEAPDLNAPDPEAPDLNASDPRLQEETQAPYSAHIEVEAPAFHTFSATMEKAFVRLVSKDQKEKSEPIPFTYLPSEAPPLPLKEEASTDYISRMIGEKKKATWPW